MPRIDRRASARALPSSSSCAECLETRRLLSAALLKDINPDSFGSSSGYFTPLHAFTYFSSRGQ